MFNNHLVSAGESPLARLLSEPALGARRRLVSSGAVIHDAGAAADNIFLIQSGLVRQYQLSMDGSRRLNDISGPGNWLGIESVGGQTAYPTQAVAATETTVLVLPVRQLLAVLPQHPQVSLEIIRQLTERLATVTEEAGELAFDDCRRRLIKTLLKFGHSAAATATREGVMLRMTHEQLAQAVGAARETITLVLTQLRNENILTTGRNKLTFDPRALNDCLNGVEHSAGGDSDAAPACHPLAARSN
jgi:CRP/FNR family transcriptional regulator